MTIPGLREANSIMADLKRLGIYDVELMFDKEVVLWAVVQTFKPAGKILLLNEPSHREGAPMIMWWVRNDDMTYRTPSNQDLSDIVTTVKRAQVWFDKGSDKMIDQIEAKEKTDHEVNRIKQSEKIRSFAKPMKKAMKRELL